MSKDKTRQDVDNTVALIPELAQGVDIYAKIEVNVKWQDGGAEITITNHNYNGRVFFDTFQEASLYVEGMVDILYAMEQG